MKIVETMQYTDEEIKSLQSGYELQRRTERYHSVTDESACVIPGRLMYQSKRYETEGNEFIFMRLGSSFDK
jgi:hypothetical protein